LAYKTPTKTVNIGIQKIIFINKLDFINLRQWYL
jgi:hypothetical protein